MLIITNLAAVERAFADKSPRPIREVMLEVYPGAVEDSNGRFHAPYDGYVCPLTQFEFRGGEYLPMNDPDEALRVTSSSKRYPEGITLDGKTHKWSGTHAQNVAVWGELIAQTRAHEAKFSSYVGTVGQKVEVGLTITHIHGFSGYYDNVYIHVMKDDLGNVFIYKKSGSRVIKGTHFGRKIEVQVGDRLKLSARVKEHKERDGVKQTILERPKIID